MTAQIIAFRRAASPCPTCDARPRLALAVPATPPVVAWDPSRGVFIVAPDDSRWADVRAAYDRLAVEAVPLVTWGPPAWRCALARLRRAIVRRVRANMGGRS
ncbi:hypothetical protein [Phenylobacterium sp.]|uniref:hypothetical protein n=1 Tax=Phenylobacterium sp. TaxID=1871053 RepID=UPI00272F319D|nr:hypothetical protein [Phenylobacterium sp.]MDP2214741.1 hypothetical protein [Phenylobacterium sp.]